MQVTSSYAFLGASHVLGFLCAHIESYGQLRIWENVRMPPKNALRRARSFNEATILVA